VAKIADNTSYLIITC